MEGPPTRAGHRRLLGLRNGVENISAVEKAGIRAYVSLKGAGKSRPYYFSKDDEFTYDAKADVYRCPAGQSLRPAGRHAARRLIKYRADAATCEVCALKPECTPSKKGREVLRYLDEEEYVDRVKGYRGSYLYEKALRKKRRVWVGALVRRSQRLARVEKVPAQEIREGERGGATDSLRAERQAPARGEPARAEVLAAGGGSPPG
ncbi:MAG: transposase [Actinomycetota bacterium]|nr:transposase [Actinomycetota bacterium]